MSLEQLPSSRIEDPFAARHHVLLQTPHERVDPLVLEQRLHEQIVGGAVMAHEAGKSLSSSSRKCLRVSME